ncbi:MAG: ABC transporter substrate-binding protein [Candidatus Delongbacteria bacterium]|nr:ABC transporter substrate-binding protein [Candidatus Delongbacteria bacterium]
MRVFRSTFPILLALGLNAQAATQSSPRQVLEQALAGADPASLAPLIQQGLAENQSKDPSRMADWKLLDLWRLEESGQVAAFDAALSTFKGSAPGAERVSYADWLQVRSLARRGSSLQAARSGCTLWLGLASDSPLLPRVQSFTTRVCHDGLNAPQRRELALWLGEERLARLPGLELLPSLHHRIAAVLPLRGHDGRMGRELLAGLEAAFAAHADGDWELVLRDCESDPLLAHQQLSALSGEELDAVIVPGEPGYAAAAAFGAPFPVIFPWYSGNGLSQADSSFYQFNTPAAHKLDELLDLAEHTLDLHNLISLIPANRAGNQLQDRLEEAALSRGMELGPPQWYLPGTKDARRQMENLCIYADAFDFNDGLLVLPLPEDADVLIPQLAAANPDGWMLGDATFLEGENPQRLSVFRDHLLVVSDWLPAAGLDGSGPFMNQVRVKEGREASRNETVGFECARLLLLAGQAAAEEGRSFREALEHLDLPSAYGGDFRLEQRVNQGLRTLIWDGSRFTPWGGR